MSAALTPPTGRVGRVTVAETAPDPTEELPSVFRNGAFLRLWLSQAATQIGGNMVLSA